MEIYREPLKKGEEALSKEKKASSLNEALKDVFYLQESVFESYDVKKPLFKEMSEIADAKTILASSTSGLLMSKIQRAVKNHPERCVIAHPWNPPHLMPLVEIVPRKKTSKEVIDETIKLMKEIGKKPALLRKEVVGMIGNRLSALWREAVDLVNKGIATVEDVDNVIKMAQG
ncbi:MAG: 3-hydroxyacyl-CoA dehydrogenase NAD-binding domain-containing protein [Nitrososphaerales archaeon]